MARFNPVRHPLMVEARGCWYTDTRGRRAGGMLPFGPYVIFPLAAALRDAGAGTATLVAFVSGWMLWTTGKLAYEFATLGPGFSARRLALYAIFPPLAGILTLLLFGN